MLETLSKMEYPGRGIVVGKTIEDEILAIYFITGRSDSSKARRLRVSDDNQFVFIQVTDPKELEKGDPALLVYTAIAFGQERIVISNGGQTDLIRATARAIRLDTLGQRDSLDILKYSFKEPYFVPKKDGTVMDLTSYEPDPNHTPRISTFIDYYGAAFSVIKRGASGEADKVFDRVPLISRKGRMITTYTGDNIEPLPSFIGKPIEVGILGLGADLQEIADTVYEALGEFRVSVACLIKRKDGTIDIKTKNLHE